jgi:hypothetical protein
MRAEKPRGNPRLTAAEFCPLIREIPQIGGITVWERRKTAGLSGLSRGGGWRRYCPEPCGHYVLRAAVFSIVLTLAVGPNAALLCAVWCHPEEARTSDCQHQDATASPRATGEDSCRTAPASTAAFVREDAKRASASADAQHANPTPRFLVAPPLADATRAYPPPTSLGAAAPPVLIALRI